MPENPLYSPSPQPVSNPYTAGPAEELPPVLDEDTGQAEKSACAIVFIILLVLLLASGGVWYYLTKYKKSATKVAPIATEELQKIPNLIKASKGGRVTYFDLAEVIIPPGALGKDTIIEIERVESGSVTDLYHLKPDGLKFLKPVTVAIAYKASGLLPGQMPSDIRLEYSLDKKKKKFLKFSVDQRKKKLRTQVQEL